MRPELKCDCGAACEAIEITMLGYEPTFVRGELLEPCICPKCVSCHFVLDGEGRCPNLDCPLLGVLIVLPD